jgi:hypothetical protein
LVTPAERKSLAEQLMANPLYEDLLSQMERDATEALIWATNENDRISAQWRVRAARTFRSDCEAFLRNTHERRGAPA